MMRRPRDFLLSMFSHRLLAVARWDLHLLRLRVANRLRGEQARLTQVIAARPRPLFLNLGAGPRGIVDPHWLNVDACATPGVDAQLDLARPLPFPTAAFDGAFCEHVLEHFTQDEAACLLREVRRVLRPGAMLRVVVPDAELVLRLYLEQPARLLALRGDDAAATPMEAVNSFFRQRYEHQFLYDADTLEAALRAAGFIEVGRVRPEQGADPRLLIDDPRYGPESLYIEARA
jgi:predicted SAM-dependent methyltransferase